MPMRFEVTSDHRISSRSRGAMGCRETRGKGKTVGKGRPGGVCVPLLRAHYCLLSSGNLQHISARCALCTVRRWCRKAAKKSDDSAFTNNIYSASIK